MPKGKLNGRAKLIPTKAKNEYKKLIEETPTPPLNPLAASHPWACLDTINNASGDSPMSATRQLNRLPDRKNNKDLQYFEGLCAIQCTETEIAGVMHTDIDTVNRFCKDMYGMTFTEIRKILSQNGKMSLRRAQFRQAIEKDNPVMQIWLGKQYLGQADKVEQNMSGSVVLIAGQGDLQDYSEPELACGTGDVIEGEKA